MRPIITVLLAALFGATAGSHAQTAASAELTLSGQVVCSACWNEVDNRKATGYGTQADLQCAEKCSANGVPRALAVWNGDHATLYILEKGAYPTRDPAYLDLVPRMVTIRGPVRAEGEEHYIKVNSVRFDDTPPAPQAPPVAKVGDAAPALELTDLSGARQTLASYRGKVVVLNFWATWCGPCRREMPAFVALHGKYAERGVQIIAASADSAETVARVAPYAESEKLPFAVWTGVSPQLMASFGLPGVLPCTVVIGRDGRIVQEFVGMINEAQVASLLDQMLAA